MPPRHKKVGRPLGSKNKKPSKLASVLREIKSEANLIKSENVANANGDDSYESDCSNQDVSNVSLAISAEKKKIVYNCKKCPNKNFKFKKNFKEHLLMEHSTLPGSLACDLCDAVCPNQFALDAHITKSHNRELFSCKYCNKEFVRQAHVLRHMAQKGCDGSGVAYFPCEICTARFTRKDNLIVHLRQMHIRNAFYSCKHDGCEFTSKNFTKLIRHWHSTHADIPCQFECDSCGKATMSRAAMAKHLEIHGEKKYACDVCDYSTHTIEVMRRHILTHVDDKPYKCSVCGNSYIQRAQLERHSMKHTGFQCVECSTEFKCKASLIHHKRSHHQGLTKLDCPFSDCSYSRKEFPNLQTLLTHINTHLEESVKSWSCEVCHKRFQSEMNMRRHLSTHTLDRPRRCMYCVSARAYVRGQQLVRHVRKFHENVFRAHLAHVRNVLDNTARGDRVSRSELESVLTLLDAEAERILEGYGGSGVLYGGMQPETTPQPVREEESNSPLMSEEVLADTLRRLLAHLIDDETLQCFGWPNESIDNILEKVIEQCGAKPADRDMWTRVQRLRENAKHLFLYVVDDKNVATMLGTHTIDQIIKHILLQVDDDNTAITTTDIHPEIGGDVEIELEVS